MSSINSQELNFQTNSVLANKSKITTTEEVYNNIYYKQFFELFKLTVSFLVGNILIRMFDNTLLNSYIKNKVMYLIITTFLLISIIFIALNIFTYLQISNEQEKLLDKFAN